MQKITERITDFEKAVFVASKIKNISGYRIAPEDILGMCQNSNWLDYYYQGFKSEDDTREYAVRLRKGGL